MDRTKEKRKTQWGPNEVERPKTGFSLGIYASETPYTDTKGRRKEETKKSDARKTMKNKRKEVKDINTVKPVHTLCTIDLIFC